MSPSSAISDLDYLQAAKSWALTSSWSLSWIRKISTSSTYCYPPANVLLIFFWVWLRPIVKILDFDNSLQILTIYEYLFELVSSTFCFFNFGSTSLSWIITLENSLIRYKAWTRVLLTKSLLFLLGMVSK